MLLRDFIIHDSLRPFPDYNGNTPFLLVTQKSPLIESWKAAREPILIEYTPEWVKDEMKPLSQTRLRRIRKAVALINQREEDEPCY